MVESTDVVFAVDSVPAIFGVSRETFIVFSSNAFAILGLIAWYCLQLSRPEAALLRDQQGRYAMVVNAKDEVVAAEEAVPSAVA